jgi:transposase-like protein
LVERTYLYRDVDRDGNKAGFRLSARRDLAAAKALLRKALNKRFNWAAINIIGIELMHIRKGQCSLARFQTRGQVTPAAWRTVLTV